MMADDQPQLFKQVEGIIDGGPTDHESLLFDDPIQFISRKVPRHAIYFVQQVESFLRPPEPFSFEDIFEDPTQF